MNHPTSPSPAAGFLLEPSAALHEKLDRAGATASFLCAIHCLVAPLLAATAAAGALVFFHREIESLFIGTSLLLGAWSLGWGYLQHRKGQVLALYFLAAAAFATALLAGAAHFEIVFMVAGGLLLASGHLLNRRFLAR